MNSTLEKLSPWLFSLVVFLSAGLVFMVEPMVARLLLPKQGGWAAEWRHIGPLLGESRRRLSVVQQARPEDVEQVREAYGKAGIAAEIEPFFKDLPARMAAAQLIVARSGASTVAELAAIGRPSILVPLPGAIDQDQAANARSLAQIGAATVIPQDELTPERLADEIERRLAQPSALTEAAAAAKGAGVLDAAERLAAVVMSLAKLPVPTAEPARAGL